MTSPLLDTLSRAISADIPAILWGPPGAGKTASLLSLAVEARAEVQVLIGSTLDPTDIGGLPLPNGQGGVCYAPPPWAERMAETLDAGRPAWLVLDELSTAPPAVQAAFLRVVHERKVGPLSIEGCRIVAAANPADTAADGGWLSPAMAARFLHLQFAPDPSTWVSGELAGWGRQRSADHARAAAVVAGFISKHPSSLAPPHKGAFRSDTGTPNPRAWSASARFLSTFSDPWSSAQVALTGLSGIVGADAAAELATWAREQDLPDPEEVLVGRAKLPGRADKLMAALGALAAAACSENPARKDRILTAWGILGGLKRTDVALSAAQALLTAAPGIAPPEALNLGAKILTVGGGVEEKEEE